MMILNKNVFENTIMLQNLFRIMPRFCQVEADITHFLNWQNLIIVLGHEGSEKQDMQLIRDIQKS